MGGGNLKNGMRQGRRSQPDRNLKTKDPLSHWNWSFILDVSALTGYHQYEPQPFRKTIQNKTMESGRSVRKSHSVKIESRFWTEFASRHPTEMLAVHIDRSRW
jgi:hypothetical protein